MAPRVTDEDDDLSLSSSLITLDEDEDDGLTAGPGSGEPSDALDFVDFVEDDLDDDDEGERAGARIDKESSLLDEREYLADYDGFGGDDDESESHSESESSWSVVNGDDDWGGGGGDDDDDMSRIGDEGGDVVVGGNDDDAKLLHVVDAAPGRGAGAAPVPALVRETDRGRSDAMGSSGVSPPLAEFCEVVGIAPVEVEVDDYGGSGARCATEKAGPRGIVGEVEQSRTSLSPSATPSTSISVLDGGSASTVPSPLQVEQVPAASPSPMIRGEASAASSSSSPPFLVAARMAMLLLLGCALLPASRMPWTNHHRVAQSSSSSPTNAVDPISTTSSSSSSSSPILVSATAAAAASARVGGTEGIDVEGGGAHGGGVSSPSTPNDYGGGGSIDGGGSGRTRSSFGYEGSDYTSDGPDGNGKDERDEGDENDDGPKSGGAWTTEATKRRRTFEVDNCWVRASVIFEVGECPSDYVEGAASALRRLWELVPSPPADIFSFPSWTTTMYNTNNFTTTKKTEKNAADETQDPFTEADGGLDHPDEDDADEANDASWTSWFDRAFVDDDAEAAEDALWNAGSSVADALLDLTTAFLDDANVAARTFAEVLSDALGPLGTASDDGGDAKKGERDEKSDVGSGGDFSSSSSYSHVVELAREALASAYDAAAGVASGHLVDAALEELARVLADANLAAGGADAGATSKEENIDGDRGEGEADGDGAADRTSASWMKAHGSSVDGYVTVLRDYLTWGMDWGDAAMERSAFAGDDGSSSSDGGARGRGGGNKNILPDGDNVGGSIFNKDGGGTRGGAERNDPVDFSAYLEQLARDALSSAASNPSARGLFDAAREAASSAARVLADANVAAGGAAAKSRGKKNDEGGRTAGPEAPSSSQSPDFDWEEDAATMAMRAWEEMGGTKTTRDVFRRLVGLVSDATPSSRSRVPSGGK